MSLQILAVPSAAAYHTARNLPQQLGLPPEATALMVSLKITADHRSDVLHGWVQALWEGQNGRASCHVCEREAGMHGALPWDTSWELMVTLWWESATDCLIRNTKTVGPEVGFPQTTGRSLLFTGPGPHEGFQQSQHLLKCSTAGHRQSRRILEHTQWYLLDAPDWGVEGRHSTGPHAYREGRTAGAVKVRDNLGCDDHEWWSLGSWEKGKKLQAPPSSEITES